MERKLHVNPPIIHTRSKKTKKKKKKQIATEEEVEVEWHIRVLFGHDNEDGAAATMRLALDGIAIKCMHAYRKCLAAVARHHCRLRMNATEQSTPKKKKHEKKVKKKRNEKKTPYDRCEYFSVQFCMRHITHTGARARYSEIGCVMMHKPTQKAEWSHIHACDNMPRPGEHITTAFRTRPIHD